MVGIVDLSLTEMPGTERLVDRALSRTAQTADRIRDNALNVEFRTNADITARLNQIDSIVEKTAADVQAIEAQTSLDVNAAIKLVDIALSRLRSY